MSNMIRYNGNSKENVKGKLSTVENTLSVNISGISSIYDTLNLFNENPEMAQILSEVLKVKENKGVVKNNVSELRQKMDVNLELISDLDSDTAEMFKEW